MLVLEVPPGLPAIAPAQEAIAAHLAGLGLPDLVALRVRLVVEELLANLALHATWPDGPAPARLEVAVEEAAVVLAIEDLADPFDPREAPEPARPSLEEDSPLGGLGLALVRRTASRIAYRRLEGGRNRTELWVRV